MKVKLTGFWADDETMINNFSRYNYGNLSWKNMHLTLDDDYDFLVVLTRPYSDDSHYNAKNIITFLTEPPLSLNHTKIQYNVNPMYLPLPFWDNFTNRDWSILKGKKVAKNQLLSSVISGLSFLEGQLERLKFAAILDRNIVEGFDLWGKHHNNKFLSSMRNYKGELKNKYDALWNYKYHYTSENSFISDYFTEKIVDPIIAESLCFYDGCLNLESYIDERSFIRINLKKPASAFEKIIKTIKDNQWNYKVKYIRQQKKRMLNELNPLNIIWLAVNGKDVLKECLL